MKTVRSKVLKYTHLCIILPIDASCLKFYKLFFHELDVDYATTKQWRLLTLYTVITHAQFQSRLIRNRGDKINHIFGIHNPDLPIHYTLQYAYGGCSFGPNFDDFGDNIGFWYEFKWYNPKRHIIEWFHIFELQHVKIWYISPRSETAVP